MNWLEMFAVIVLAILFYLFITGLAGSIANEYFHDSSMFATVAWFVGTVLFVIVVVSWAYGLSFPLTW